MRLPFLLSSILLLTQGVLLIPAASAADPDGLPLLDWEGRRLPPLPAQCLPLGEAALRAARSWAELAGLSAWDPTLAARSTTAFHIVGWALPRAPGLPPEPAATGWWAADPTQATAALSLMGTWPGQSAVVSDDRLQLTHPRTPVVGETTVDGMRLRIHGPALAACLKPMVGDKTAWEPVVTAVANWQLETTISPDGTCRIDTGIPRQVLAPVDPEAVGRLPPARVTIALGIASTANPLVLPEGTWACSWNGDQHLVIVMPDGPQVRPWLLGWTTQVPEKNLDVVALGDQGPWLQREDHGWRLAFVREDLDAAPRGTPASATTPAPLGQLQVRATSAINDTSVAKLPWPIPNLGNWFSTDLDVQIQVDGGDTAVVQTQDPAVAWLLPTLALRWFADEVADQHGMAKLRGVLTRLKAAGIPMTRDELQASQPAVPDAKAWLDRAKAWDHTVDAPEPTILKEALASTRLPLTVATPAQLEAARAFGREIAPLLALPAEQISSIPWQGAPPSVSPPGILLPFISLQRQAVKSGLLLVQHGDAQGLALVDDGWASLGRPSTLIEALVLNSAHNLRDHAWLTATVQGLSDPTRWLAEPYRVEDESRTAWSGERVMSGWVAQAWLGTPQETAVSWPTSTRWLGRHPLVPTWDRAAIATDLVDWLDRLENPAVPVLDLDLTVGRSRFIQALIPSTEMIRTQLEVGRIRHHLTRLAGAIVLQARRQPLPENPADLGRALTIPGPTGPLSCTWQRLDGTSFRLALDVRGSEPAEILAKKWQQWQKETLPDTSATLVISGTLPLIQVHQVAAPKAPNPNF